MTLSLDLPSILANIGVDIYRETGDELLGKCPKHLERTGKEDAHPSWSINQKTYVHHCLKGDTLVLTKEYGWRPIRELDGMAVSVLDGDGKWTPSPIKSYGIQNVYDITLSRNGKRQVVSATDKHRWFRKAKWGSKSWEVETTTDSLHPKQVLPSVWPTVTRSPASARTHVSPYGVPRGFVFGDGTHREGVGSIAYFHPGKDEPLLPFFDTAYGIRDDKARLTLDRGLPSYWKLETPSLGEPRSYLYGWLAGYFAADGCVSTDGQIRLNSARRSDLEFVERLCLVLGIKTHGIGCQEREGFGRVSTLYHIDLSGDCLTEAFFILPQHRERFLVSKRAFSRDGWTVVSVSTTPRSVPVYCAEVPTTHSFVIDGYLLTGNCFSCGYAGSLTSLYMDMVGSVPDDLEWELRKQSVTAGAAKMAAEAEPEVEGPKVSEWTLRHYADVPQSLLDRRYLTREAADLFQIRWDQERKVWVLPIRSMEGVLLGYQFRQKGVELNHPPEMKKSSTLFGGHLFLNERRITVVESPLDAVRFGSIGIPCVATMGASISQSQVRTLFRHYNTIVSAMDNDNAGRKATEYLLTLARNRGTLVLPMDYTGLPGKDPGDVPSHEQLRDAWTRSVSLNLKGLA